MNTEAVETFMITAIESVVAIIGFALSNFLWIALGVAVFYIIKYIFKLKPRNEKEVKQNGNTASQETS